MDWTISRENAKQWDLAYAFGAFQGDGFLGYSYAGNGGWYTTGIGCMDLEIVLRFHDQICSVFGRDYAINTYLTKNGTKMYVCRASCAEVCAMFGINTDFKKKVPDSIIQAPIQVVREYIAGLFDTDGTVAHCINNKETGGKRFQLKLGLTEQRVVESVATLLHKHGVKVGVIGQEKKGSYRTIYRIQPSLRSFIDAGFYFRCKRKEKRVIEYLGIASETLHADPLG